MPDVATDTTEDGLDFACTETLSPLRDFLRPQLLRSVQWEAPIVVPFVQRLCGVYPPKKSKCEETDSGIDHDGKWSDPTVGLLSRLFYTLLSGLLWLGVTFGCEVFYITCFPFLFWNVDAALGRRVVILWATEMYIGQSLKDLFQLPRPVVVAPTKVRVLEKHWLAEYGFPSTHIMAVMGQAGMVVHFTNQEDYAGAEQYPLAKACLLGAFFVSLTFAGRLFVGVHSLTDLFGGILFGGLTFFSFTFFADWIDEYILFFPGALYFPTIICVILLMVYPAPKRWTNAYGDTAMVAGVANGICVGSHLAAQMNLPRIPLNWLNTDFSYWISLALLRTAIGALVLVAIKEVTKLVCMAVLQAVLSKSRAPLEQRYALLVPTRFISYSVVGIMAAGYMLPLYSVLGLELPTPVIA